MNPVATAILKRGAAAGIIAVAPLASPRCSPVEERWPFAAEGEYILDNETDDVPLRIDTAFRFGKRQSRSDPNT